MKREVKAGSALCNKGNWNDKYGTSVAQGHVPPVLIRRSQVSNVSKCSDFHDWKVPWCLTLNHLHFLSAFFCWVTTVDEVSVLEGGSITVPCRYDPQYANHVKYWCWGSMRAFCSSLARTDETRPTNPTEDKVSIFDDPAQEMFTVTMNKLKEGDSGWYMCGVEIGNGWKPDDVAYTKVKVIHGE